MPQSSQLAGDVRTRQWDTWVHGHQPIPTVVQQCCSGVGEALIGAVGSGEPGELCP